MTLPSSLLHLHVAQQFCCAPRPFASHKATFSYECIQALANTSLYKTHKETKSVISKAISLTLRTTRLPPYIAMLKTPDLLNPTLQSDNRLLN
ncbi:unnamed protein product [Agarophyton chilense]